jgi:hypothetical protein
MCAGIGIGVAELRLHFGYFFLLSPILLTSKGVRIVFYLTINSA